MSNKLSSQLSFLLKFKIYPPEAEDAINPHGPKFSVAIREYMIAGLVRDIAQKIPKREIKAKLLSVGKALVGVASKGLIVAWEDGDDICPPYFPHRFPPPPPGPYPDPDPQPYPWRTAFEVDSAFDRVIEQKQLIGAIKLLAILTSQKELGEQLGDIGSELDQHLNKGEFVNAN
ncbi:hypothetical protein C3K47_02940 [Solitalea longa]|uniref:Uncharacterized protein n=1 Tax=Solitalea longa TaxID=2079460 RepID=A0A2S5A6Z5_9SPHI|nr:hypothetical protein [Solitalea longa]POY38370.1 hypothetical protein C3K47_02940 [Solitalea longa]